MGGKYIDLLSPNDIIQVLTKNLAFNLKAVGKNIFFLCPFHDDHHPSFCFSPRYKLFKCFSCNNFNQGKPGDIFILISQYKRISFLKALEEVGKMGFFSFNAIKKEEEKKKKDNNFLVTLITDIYHYNLWTKEGNIVYQYLVKKRRIKEEIIKTFLLGCTIQEKQLTNLIFNEEKFDFFTQTHIGLWQISSEGNESEGEIKDFFPVYRLVFPLKNELGEIVTWATRRITLGEDNKYCFLPGFEEKKKSDFLYNFFEAKHSIEKEIFLVEGFFDVISLTQIGVTNCIALLGTNISYQQIKLLQSLEKRIILFLDSDIAGREATIKIIISLLIKGIDCETVSLIYSGDPDKLCNENNDLENIKSVLNSRTNPYKFVIQHFFEKNKVKNNPQRTGNFIRNVAEIFSSCFSVPYSFLIEEIQQLTNWERRTISSFFSRGNYLALLAKDLLKDFFQLKIAFLEERILNWCLRNWNCFFLIFNSNFFFENEKIRRTYQAFIYNYYNGISFCKLEKKDPDNQAISLNNIISLLKQTENIKTFRDFYEKN